MADDLQLEPWQQKLRDFVVKVPYHPLELPSGTPVLKSPTKAQVDAAVAAKTVATNGDFSKLTGMSHLDLLRNWEGGGIMTSCNGFVIQCCTEMGYHAATKGLAVGQFEIAKILYNNGLGHCWVPAGSGDRPRYGDVFKPRHTHMGLSLHFAGDTWHTAEGGQGGRGNGYDSVKKKTTPWDPSSLEGWVNMAALLAAGKIVSPSWLGGWWKVTENGGTPYFYHFHASGAVCFTPAPPSSPFSPPINPSMTGSYRMLNMFDVLVHWTGADDDEHFEKVWQAPPANPNVPAKPEHMIGIKQDKGRFKAEKLGVPAIAAGY